MGKIKKLIENELIGGTQSTDVYPVTSVKAVYDENNERLDHILNRRGAVNISTNYNSDHIAEVLTLEQAIAKVPSKDRVLGFQGKFQTPKGWKSYIFTGDSVSNWSDTSKWIELISSADLAQGLGDSASKAISQSAVTTEVTLLNNLIGHYGDELEEITDYLTTDGYYINPRGEKTPINEYIYSNPIAVKANTLYILKCAAFESNIAVISECDINGDNISPVCISSNNREPSVQNRTKTYYYIPRTDGYIIVCYNKYISHALYSVLPSAIYGLISNIQKILNKDIIDKEVAIADSVEISKNYYDIIRYSGNIRINSSNYRRTYLDYPRGGYYPGAPTIGTTYTGAVESFNDNSDYYVACTKLKLKEGDKITFKIKPNVFGSANSFIYTDKDKKVVTVINNDKVTAGYEFTAPCDGIAYINYPAILKTSSDAVLFIVEYKKPVNILSLLKINEDIAVINEKLKIKNVTNVEAEIGVDGKFISASSEGGKCGIYTLGGYMITKPISISKGEVILYKGNSYSTNVSIFAETNDDGATYYSLLQCNLEKNTNGSVFVYYVAPKNMNIAVCCMKSDYAIYKGLATDYFIRDAYRINAQLLKLSDKITNNANRIDELSNKARYIDLFNKILFIGDSVTDGHVIDHTNGVSRVVRAMSYPTKLNQLVPHLKIINNAHAGESVQGWNNNRFQTEFENVKDGVDLTIIELGWNQTGNYAWQSDLESFNTVFQSDVKDHGDDFSSYNTTNSVVGNYCQLVKKIQNSTPNMTIILVASFGWDQLRSDFVKAIAEWAGVCFIDGHTNIPDGGDNVHFTPFGYLNKAHLMLNYINDALLEKEEYVKMNIYKNNGLVG